ncbi:hypothetical protein [Streptomyces montanisoli]|uniref:DUF4352 domain-containing protein n=1 Tax=Streptomyces montanisoli TaxID=2798581 RepID=A0A940MET3_9ACTN|nr:hypothetical protein [Streptomyces montanisoli]MBP0459934.1 hypothetical protein [Streptomyces montanisoli]
MSSLNVSETPSSQPSADRLPPGSRARLARRIVLATAATAVGCSLCACSDIGGTQSDTASASPADTVSASQDAQSAEDAQDAQDDSGGDTFTVALDKTAAWTNGVEAHLSGFGRGTSGEYASPSHKAYLSFSVTMRNGSKSSIDLSLVSVSCPGGADEIVDMDAGFKGAPDAHLLPGKSLTWKEACEFPKTAKSAQIEITPTDITGDGWYRTAIFTGQVR